MKSLLKIALLCVVLLTTRIARSAELGEFIWPDLAPREESLDTGTLQPFRPNEHPPVSRVVNIRRPTLDVFLPEKGNGTAVLILPGGGFGKVVPDKEGSEAAPWLNKMGIATFVLRYRTNEAKSPDEPSWLRPLQDAQRAMRLIRSRAEQWNLRADRIGVIGFSAGGQVAAMLHTATGPATYEPIDDIDKLSYRPDFSLLIYPWQVLDPKTQQLLPQIQVTAKSPPAFLVHTHDDRSSSLGSTLIYADHRRHGVDAELHIYENGGHGYGMRAVPGSNIGSWPARAGDWLRRRGLGH